MTRGRLALLFTVAMLRFSCDAGLCRNEVIEEAVSPDRKHIAAVFERNCGATTPYVTVVGLRAIEAKFDADDADDWVFTARGQSQVHVVWFGVDGIKVTYSGTGDPATRRDRWREITVSYE